MRCGWHLVKKALDDDYLRLEVDIDVVFNLCRLLWEDKS